MPGNPVKSTVPVESDAEVAVGANVPVKPAGTVTSAVTVALPPLGSVERAGDAEGPPLKQVPWLGVIDWIVVPAEERVPVKVLVCGPSLLFVTVKTCWTWLPAVVSAGGFASVTGRSPLSRNDRLEGRADRLVRAHRHRAAFVALLRRPSR